MLILTRKLNESITIADNIEISVIEIKGDQVKLGVEAPKEIKVFRKEVYLAIQKENREAARTTAELPALGGLLGNQNSSSSSSSSSGISSSGSAASSDSSDSSI